MHCFEWRQTPSHSALVGLFVVYAFTLIFMLVYWVYCFSVHYKKKELGYKTYSCFCPLIHVNLNVDVFLTVQMYTKGFDPCERVMENWIVLTYP